MVYSNVLWKKTCAYAYDNWKNYAFLVVDSKLEDKRSYTEW
jgi:hypothetical protein